MSLYFWAMLTVTILEIFMKSIELIFKVSRTVVFFFFHKEKRIGRFVKTPHTHRTGTKYRAVVKSDCMGTR